MPFHLSLSDFRALDGVVFVVFIEKDLPSGCFCRVAACARPNRTVLKPVRRHEVIKPWLPGDCPLRLSMLLLEIRSGVSGAEVITAA